MFLPCTVTTTVKPKKLLGAPDRVQGEEIKSTRPMVPAGSLPVLLNAAQVVLLAEPKAAKGIYTQEIEVTLLIPGGTIPGRYVGETVVNVAVRV